MKRLSVQLGAQEGIGLTDRNVYVGVVQNTLRISIRPEGAGDWGTFFARYGEELRRAMVVRWENGRLAGTCTCSSASPIVLKGWFATRESWIEPLDLISLAVLAIAFAMSFARRE
jgi:hypothetical protein